MTNEQIIESIGKQLLKSLEDDRKKIEEDFNDYLDRVINRKYDVNSNRLIFLLDHLLLPPLSQGQSKHIQPRLKKQLYLDALSTKKM